MSEYIKKEAAVELLKEIKTRVPDDLEMCVQVSIDVVNAIPAADVEPVVRGEWIEMRDPYGDLTGWIHEECAHAMKLEKVALKLGKVPNGEAGNRVLAIYACPNCGTLRIRIKELR